MSYVYGTLGENVSGYHAMNHLIKDNLMERVEPRTIDGAIASTGVKSAVPVAVGLPDRKRAGTLPFTRTRTRVSFLRAGPAFGATSEHELQSVTTGGVRMETVAEFSPELAVAAVADELQPVVTGSPLPAADVADAIDASKVSVGGSEKEGKEEEEEGI